MGREGNTAHKVSLEVVLMEQAAPKHISVCIPTYKRPWMLQRCLEALERQEVDNFSYSVVVVDNDAERSARDVVERRAKCSPIPIQYHVEPVRSFSLARNKAVECSRGDLIAFIDDDEFPERSWLLSLYNAYRQYRVDGVLGPVLPFFEVPPPKWLAMSGLCNRPSFETGIQLTSSKYMRTGNVLLKRDILDEGSAPFDPSLGRTGGEDADLFERLLRKGCSFVWCRDARVREEVPEERQKRTYYLRRALLRGITSARDESFFSLDTFKSLVAVVLYTASLPLLVIATHHLFMRYLVKDCDHVAKLLARCGLILVRERAF